MRVIAFITGVPAAPAILADIVEPIEAQSAAIARAMASIGNDERASFGPMSGHDRRTLSRRAPGSCVQGAIVA
jgi:hypothetical protein